MSNPTKREHERLLEQALSSPEFMAQVRQAVLESPIVQAKDAELAALRARCEAAEAALDMTTRQFNEERARRCEEIAARLAAERSRDEAHAENVRWATYGGQIEEVRRERDEAREALRDLLRVVKGYWRASDTGGVVDRAKRVLDQGEGGR